MNKVDKDVLHDFAVQVKELDLPLLNHLADRLWVMGHDLHQIESFYKHKNAQISTILILDSIINEFWKVCYREQQARDGKISSEYPFQ